MAALDIAALGDNALRVITLFVPTLLGTFIAWRRWISTEDSVVAALNAFVLFACFPALIAHAVIGVDPSAVSGLGFWLIMPILSLLSVGLARLTGSAVGDRVGGTNALCLLFGNIAFLGLPYVVKVFGEGARGPAAIMVAMQVSIGVAGGPALLSRWSGDGSAAIAWRRLFGQPLFWSPFIGLAIRVLPERATVEIADAIHPLATAAAPTAMFVLGLYLARPGSERAAVNRRGVVSTVLNRLVIAPAIAVGVGAVLVAVDLVSPTLAAIAVVMAACPAAVTTFTLAQNEGVEEGTVATIVVWSSLISVLTLPLWASLAEALW